MKKEKLNFKLECEGINVTFCDSILELKKHWNKVTKYISQNRKFYDGNENELYKIFAHTRYVLGFEGKITSNIFREEFYEIHFYQTDNREDVRLDFKPEKIDKTLESINRLLQSENPLDLLMGKLGVDAFYMFLFTLDKVVNPLFVIMTDDGDGWEDMWEHYITALRFNTIDFKNLNYIPYYYRQAYCGYHYGRNFRASNVYKVYVKQGVKQLYLAIDEEVEHSGIDSYWSGEITDISQKKKPGYALLANINKAEDCKLDCGTSHWASRYDDPMDI